MEMSDAIWTERRESHYEQCHTRTMKKSWTMTITRAAKRTWSMIVLENSSIDYLMLIWPRHTVGDAPGIWSPRTSSPDTCTPNIWAETAARCRKSIREARMILVTTYPPDNTSLYERELVHTRSFLFKSLPQNRGTSANMIRPITWIGLDQL